MPYKDPVKRKQYAKQHSQLYREKHHEELLQKKRGYYTLHQEKLNEQAMKRYWKNRTRRLELAKIWYNENKKYILNRNKELGRIRKNTVFSYYSKKIIKCNCCQEDDINFLTMDHINGRKQHNHNRTFSGDKLYKWLIENGYPSGFQVLCMNCNWAKREYGICPHKKIKSSQGEVTNESKNINQQSFNTGVPNTEQGMFQDSTSQ